MRMGRSVGWVLVGALGTLVGGTGTSAYADPTAAGPANAPAAISEMGAFDMDGGIDDALREPLIAATRQGVGQGNLRLARAGDPPADYCVDGRLTAQGRIYDVQFQLVSLRTREVVQTVREHCEYCTSDEVLDSVRRAAAALGLPLAERSASAAVVDVAQPIPEPPRRRPPATLLWAGVLAGLASIALGAALVVLDGRCSGGDVGVGGHCQFVYTTGPAGWILGGTGLAVAGLGFFALRYEWSF